MATYLGSVTGLSDPHQHGSGHLDGASRSVWQRTPSTPAAVVQLVLLSGRAGEATRRIFAFAVSPVTSSRSSPDEPQAAHGHKASQAPPGVETVLSGWRDGRLLGKSMSPSPPRAAPAHGGRPQPVEICVQYALVFRPSGVQHLLPLDVRHRTPSHLTPPPISFRELLSWSS